MGRLNVKSSCISRSSNERSRIQNHTLRRKRHLAVNRTFTNAQGEREADFINCVVFRRQAENVNNYLSKGSLAGVDGRIQSRSYENQEGRRIFVTEVVSVPEPKMHNMVANVHRTIISKTTVKDLVVSNQDKIHLTTTIHQTQISRIIRLQMLMDRLISVMMIYHSNNERIK